ncbi:listeria/Bacterioides repeat [Clostridium sp. CAG:964]|mgnify:CR=1 FL=1|nr:listeria/Bacterioides repeat [Clostridium sp. CAG:964]
MNVKTLKRMSKRSVSVLLTVLMIISLFTVCMVGTTVTAGAVGDSIGGKTITLKVSGWQNAHVFVGNDSYTSHYKMSGSSGVFTVTFPDHNWSDATYYFFSETNYNDLGDGIGTGKGVSTVRTDLINGNSTCSKLIDKSVDEINKGNVYTVDENGNVNVSSSSSTPSSSGWINATMYNYRTASQIADAMTKDGTLTEEQNYDVDSKNGQAKSIFDESVYKPYNDAVTKWYQDHSTDGKVNGVSVTPLYQGNIRAGNKAADETGTLTWAKSYFNFVSVANGANRKGGADGASINAAAVGLVDKTLSANGTIQQNGIELPQFSDAFMNANADSKIQSKYDNLKFETKVTKRVSGNEWYSYDSATDKNRSLDIANRQIRNYNNEVKGCQNESGGKNAAAGYYPFNQSQPGDMSNITNCFGTRFDIDYAMPNADGVVNGEEMQFNFTGDDDMWIYIDGHLVLDLGGSHAKASGSINLAKMKVTYSTGYYNATYDKVTDKNSASCAYHEAEEFAIGNDVKKILQDTTRTHKMTIFYMERGLFDSNLSFNFFLPQTNSLTVEQKTDTSNVNSALVNDTLQTADKDVFQTYIKSNSKSAASNNTASVTEDFTRKDVYGNTQVLQKGSSSAAQTGTPFTNSMSGDGVFAPIGNTNFVWEDKNSTNTTKGKGTPTDGTVELLYNQSATFNDQFANGSKFKLTSPDALKSFDLPNLTENQPTSKNNGRSRSDYYETTLKVTDISGSELTPNGGAYNFGDGSDNAVKINAEYTNKVRVGSVAFTKNIQGDNPDTSKYFTFKIQMRNIFGDTSDSEWKVYEGLDFTVSGIQGVKKLGSEGTVDLKHGETLTIDGVPIGTEYRITEIESGDYSVSSVTQDTEVAKNSNMVSETNGFNAKLPTSGVGQTASYTVNNTNQKVTVLYRYQDRAVETGLPTDLENHYTYFTRNIAGNINSIVDSATGNLTEDGKKKLKASLPEVSNVLMSYSVKDDIQGNVEYRTLTNDYLDTKLDLLTNKQDNSTPKAEGVPADIQALVGGTTKVLVVTYDAAPKNYTVNLTFPQLQEDGSTYAVKTSSVSGHFNSLILNVAGGSDYTAPKSYTDADSKVHTFKYWAKRVAIEGGASSNTKWVPVSTNYTYNYRITDNMELKAVYDTDEDYTQLDEPTVTADSTITYMPTGTGTGYAAAASERIYDSYSKDNTDRTRVNVIFDAVGSANLDKKITKVGYVLIKNTGSYANASEFTEDVIKDAITSTTSTINGHDALIKYYDVVGRVDFNGDSYDQDGKTWTSEYQAGQVNLTNKNRANFVFDLKNTKASHNYYFTCYTVMQRDGHTYVSKSPSYFNLGEADPNVTPVTPTEDTYNISTSARYTTDGTAYISDTKAGNVSSNGVRVVTEGKTIKVSYYPTSYTENDIQYVSQLESLKIGKQTITSDDFALLGIDPTKSGSYQFTFSKDKYLGADAAAGATLEIVASFKAEANENYITVKAPAVTNGTVKIGNDYTAQNDVTLAVEKGTSFYVKATPNTDFYFKNWTVNETTIKDNPVKVDVAEDGTLSVNGTAVNMADLTPVFVQMINVTLVSGTGGTISYSCTYNGTNVKAGTVAENSTETVKVPRGTTFTLTAKPNSGYNFTGWGADISNFGNEVKPLPTTRFEDGIFTAEFEKAPNKTLYLKLGCNEWKAGNQRFVAVLKEPGEEQIVMTKVSDDLYRVVVPSDKNYANVIFCKMSNNNEQFDWNNKDYQTDNLTIPTDGKMMYTVTEQVGTQYATGEWSVAPDDNSVTVTAPTNVANGKVYIGTDDTTQTSTTLTFTKGTAASFYVKAEPNTGYNFTGWTVNSASVSTDNPVMVSVSDSGALSVNGTTISSLNDLVPNFEGGTTGDTTTLYLKLNSDWQAAARYEIYIFDSTDGTHYWYTMEKVDDTIYKYSVPNEVINKVSGNEKNIIFVRSNPKLPEHDWASKYNQTEDLKIPTNGDTKFTITSGSGDNYKGSWSTP